MAFMPEFSNAIDEMRAAMDEMNNKMLNLETILQSHFNLNRTRAYDAIEKELKQWPSTTSEHSAPITK